VVELHKKFHPCSAMDFYFGGIQSELHKICLILHVSSTTLVFVNSQYINWRAPWKNRTSRYHIFLSPAHHSMVFYFWCSAYWSVRF